MCRKSVIKNCWEVHLTNVQVKSLTSPGKKLFVFILLCLPVSDSKILNAVFFLNLY